MALFLKRFLFFYIVFIFISCIEDDIIFTLLPEDDVQEDDYLLYSLALDQIMKSHYVIDESYIILQPSSTFSFLDDEYDRARHSICNWYQRLNEELFNSYLPLQSDVLNFGNRFTFEKEYTLLSQEEYDYYFGVPDVFSSQDSWQKFRESRGKSFFYLNRISYNEEEDYAIFEVSYGCGWLCGYGFMVDATKVDGTWEVCVQMTWVS